jgi:hypothetical protein
MGGIDLISFLGRVVAFLLSGGWGRPVPTSPHLGMHKNWTILLENTSTLDDLTWLCFGHVPSSVIDKHVMDMKIQDDRKLI